MNVFGNVDDSEKELAASCEEQTIVLGTIRFSVLNLLLCLIHTFYACYHIPLQLFRYGCLLERGTMCDFTPRSFLLRRQCGT